FYPGEGLAQGVPGQAPTRSVGAATRAPLQRLWWLFTMLRFPCPIDRKTRCRHSMPAALPVLLEGWHKHRCGDLLNMRTLAQSARDLAAGTSCRSLLEDCLARIMDSAGEGRRTFLKVYPDQGRAAADHIDALRRFGAAPSRFAGIPVSVKDLFDVAGDVT